MPLSPRTPRERRLVEEALSGAPSAEPVDYEPLTREDILAMSEDEINENWESVSEAMRKSS